ncbi:hypothetical protein IFM89_028750 [Coptis chinensis]|uniref:RRM domain-containing protein n=1 Tax=Coptis chinensis TaxID=261450 RepID=A0A835H0C9_9MAGN|nr:hypothetical protein IFM89_028750 [Coptis chinensis]
MVANMNDYEVGDLFTEGGWEWNDEDFEMSSGEESHKEICENMSKMQLCSSMAFTITTEELRAFHSVERDLFRRLVIDLRRDPHQSMEVIALWVWLEAVGYPSIIDSLCLLPGVVVNGIVKEGLTCLYHIECHIPPMPIDDNIRLTTKLMKQDISLQFLFVNRVRVRTVITRTVNDVFSRAFEDIVQEAAARRKNGKYLTLSRAVDHQATADECFSIGENERTRQLTVSPADVTMRFGTYGGGIQPHFEVGESSTQYKKSSTPIEDAPHAERTMFMTFSRGFPVTDKELQYYFQKNYGDVVETIDMRRIPPNTQALYARVTFFSSSTVAKLLKGREVVKFGIKGKTVWARRK